MSGPFNAHTRTRNGLLRGTRAQFDAGGDELAFTACAVEGPAPAAGEVALDWADGELALDEGVLGLDDGCVGVEGCVGEDGCVGVDADDVGACDEDDDVRVDAADDGRDEELDGFVELDADVRWLLDGGGVVEPPPPLEPPPEVSASTTTMITISSRMIAPP